MIPSPEDLPDHPPGFEPPSDVEVPWYAWVLWPAAITSALAVASLLLRGCAGLLA